MKEDLKLLKQNDRIEYLLRKREIEDNLHLGMPSIWTSIGILAFIILLSLTWYSAFHTLPERILSVTPLIVKILSAYIILDILLSIVSLVIYLKRKRELFNEFFEVKRKK